MSVKSAMRNKEYTVQTNIQNSNGEELARWDIAARFTFECRIKIKTLGV